MSHFLVKVCTAISLLFLVSISQTYASDELTELQQELKNLLVKQDYRGSILVAEGHSILFAHGFGFADKEQGILTTTDTQFRIGSITKQFTSAAMLVLQERGLLNLDDSVAKHLPNYPEGELFTIRQLLNHSSGLPDFWAYADGLDFAKPTTIDELVGLFKGKPLVYTPGERFIYNNAGYYLAGKIIEVVSGQSYEAFLDQVILKPLAMHDTFFANSKTGDNTEAKGYGYNYGSIDAVEMSIPHAAGAITSTALDMHKWQNAVLQKQLLSESSWQEIFKDYGHAYGLGWDVSLLGGEKILKHGGALPGFRSYIWLRPENGMSFIILSNDDGFQPEFLITKLLIKINKHQINAK